MKLASAGESRLFDVVDPPGAPLQSEAEKQAVNKYQTNRPATACVCVSICTFVLVQQVN